MQMTASTTVPLALWPKTEMTSERNSRKQDSSYNTKRAHCIHQASRT